MPGTEGGSVGTSNTGRPSAVCNASHVPCGSRIPSTAGKAIRASAGRARVLNWPTTCPRQPGSSNARAKLSELASTRASGSRSISVARAS